MKIIVTLYYFVLLTTFFKSFILCRKYNCSAQNYLFFYLLLTVLTELISRVRIDLFDTLRSGFLYNAYFILCMVFFLWYYLNIIQKKYKKISLVLATLCIISLLTFTNPLQLNFDYRLGVILPFFYIVLSLIWFYQKLLLPKLDRITGDPNFWISSALILWSCFFLFRAIPMYYLDIKDKIFLKLLKSVLYIINIIMYSMFYIALTKYERIAKIAR